MRCPSRSAECSSAGPVSTRSSPPYQLQNCPPPTMEERRVPPGRTASVRVQPASTQTRAVVVPLSPLAPEVLNGHSPAIALWPVQGCNDALHRLRRHLHFHRAAALSSRGGRRPAVGSTISAVSGAKRPSPKLESTATAIMAAIRTTHDVPLSALHSSTSRKTYALPLSAGQLPGIKVLHGKTLGTAAFTPETAPAFPPAGQTSTR